MINLLPPQYKEEFKQEENWRLVLILGILILISLISLILILFSTEIYIQGQVKSAEILVDLEEEHFQAPEIQLLRGKITLANQNLAKLNSFYQTQINSTEILEEISETFPSGIYLTSFSFQKSTSQISLFGFSPTRETLFKFKENLEEREEFTEIYFPPSNWVKPINVNFQITFKVIF